MFFSGTGDLPPIQISPPRNIFPHAAARGGGDLHRNAYNILEIYNSTHVCCISEPNIARVHATEGSGSLEAN